MSKSCGYKRLLQESITMIRKIMVMAALADLNKAGWFLLSQSRPARESATS